MSSELSLLKSQVNIIFIIGKFVELTKKAGEHKGLCPFHDDTKMSLNVNEKKQVWYCPACGDKKGDVFDFLMAKGYTLPDAIRYVQGEYNITASNPSSLSAGVPKKQKAAEWKHLRAKEPATVFTHYEHGEPTTIYTYRDSTGIIGYVCRFEFADGTKVTLPYIYAGHEGRFMWRYQGFAHRVLYNADLLEKHPKLPVVLVEGEKVADWLNERSDLQYIATTWVGGSKQVQKTPLDLLYGRRVLLWPDNDEPGFECMRYAFEHIKTDFKRTVKVAPNLPKGYDAADSGWTAQQAQDFIRRHVRVPIPKKHREDETWFTYLGFEKSENQPVFIFFCKSSKTIFRLTAANMTKSTLICLAPINWWETKFHSLKNTDAATNLMVNTSYKVGIYSPKNVRGRGVWYDDGRIVIHAGDKLIVDGEDVELGELDTRYIYEIGESFNFNTENPLTDDRSKVLLKITKLLNWERGVNAELLAGWCVIASVCGALAWRPHMWVTGGSGVGKSWVFRRLVRRLLGNTALDVQGATTEAGLRQHLCFDAMPVVFDEIESNDPKSATRVQETLELARSSSAEDTGRIIKGSASHNAKEFQIRSCFAFCSINVGIDKSSDRRRITTLSLVELADAELRAKRWEELQKLYNENISDSFIEGLHARTIKNLPVILANAKIFGDAVAKKLNSVPIGDQLGPLLAGAYSLMSETVISPEDARKYVDKQDWQEEVDNTAVKDEIELFKNLMEWKLRVDAYGERNIGELVKIAAGKDKTEEFLNSTIASAVLRRNGFKVENDFITIASSGTEIKKRLESTRWSKNYGKVLLRISGSADCWCRFTGASERSIKVPVSLIL